MTKKDVCKECGKSVAPDKPLPCIGLFSRKPLQWIWPGKCPFHSLSALADIAPMQGPAK